MSRLTTYFPFLLLMAASSMLAATAFGDEEEALTRSFYVPVELSLCEHLEDALLYRGDTPIGTLPGTHVFQFTFYPELKRLEPELERVRVEGAHDGEPFRTELIVTPSSVYIGSKKIELETDEMMKRLRHSIDARHESVELNLRCAPACSRTSASADSTR